jgi:hypothetical protein
VLVLKIFLDMDLKDDLRLVVVRWGAESDSLTQGPSMKAKERY